MKQQTGDIWSVWTTTDLLLLTTNACVKSNGALVMGRGIALQARDRFPGIDKALGSAILGSCGHLGLYGLIVSPRWPAARLGAFQVKYSYADEADIALMAVSVGKLNEWCAAHPEARVHMNYPGIGNGRLPFASVAPVVAELNDNVTLWTFR